MNTKTLIVGFFSSAAILFVTLSVLGISENSKVHSASLQAVDCIGCVVGRSSIPLSQGVPASLTFDVPNIHENSKVKLRVFVDDVKKRGTPIQVKLINQDNEKMVLSLKPEKESLLEAEITPYVRSFTRGGKLTVQLSGDNVHVASPESSIVARQPSVVVEPSTPFKAPETVKGYYIVMSGVVIEDLGGASRPAQIAKALVEEGYDVTYLYSDNTEYRKSIDSKDGRSINIDLASQYPSTLHVTDLSKFSVEDFLSSIDRTKTLVTVMEIPYFRFLEVAKTLKSEGSVVIYDVIDDWSGNWGSDIGGEVEDRAVRMSDIVSAVVPSLVEKYEANYNRAVLYLPNAVDTVLFDISKTYERPIDMPEGKTAMYYGTLWGSWFDWDLVAYLAANLPEWNFVFIGEKVENEYWNPAVDQYPNVKFLGMKPQSSLPAYAAAATVLIMPWKVDTISLGASPLKIYEWIAMQKPIVVPGLVQLSDMPAVTLSSSYKQFAQNVKNAANMQIDRVACAEFTAANDWAARAKLLAESSVKAEAFASDEIYVPELDDFWYSNWGAFYSNNTIDAGLTVNGTDIIANGTVQPKFTKGGKDLYSTSKASITIYFSVRDNIVNISEADFKVANATILTATKKGNFWDANNITFPQNLEATLDFACKASGTTGVSIQFREGTFDSLKEIYLQKTCTGTTSSSSDKGLGAGAIAGITIASLVAVIALVGGGIFWWRKRSTSSYEAVPQYD